MSEPTSGREPELHALSCVVHLHSTYSDGTATVPELIEAGRNAGRDVVLLTDHDTVGAKRDGWEGWHDDLLLGVGVEVSPNGGHYLAFGIDEEIDHRDLDEAGIMAAVADAGGFGFVAHPWSIGSQISPRFGRRHAWGEMNGSVAGVELWSLTTDIAERWTTAREAIRYLRNPERQLDGPPPHHLEWWDRACETKRVAAIGGLDAHQHGFRIRGRIFSPMPNVRYFRLFGTYALLREPPTGDAEADLQALYEALREGRVYLGVDGLAPARGFDFRGRGEGGRVALMGEEHPAGEWTLLASAPSESRLVLVRGGEEVASARGTALEAEVSDPGVYRIEARLPVQGREQRWILSNPIYLR